MTGPDRDELQPAAPAIRTITGADGKVLVFSADRFTGGYLRRQRLLHLLGSPRLKEVQQRARHPAVGPQALRSVCERDYPAEWLAAAVRTLEIMVSPAGFEPATY